MGLGSPRHVLVALARCGGTKLRTLLGSSEAAALLAWPLAACGGCAYVAAHAGVPLGPPLQRLVARAAAAVASAVRRREAPGSELGGTKRGQRRGGVGAGPWGTGHHPDKGLLSSSGLVATGVERWELTLLGWELASAEALNSHLLSGSSDAGDDAVPFLPERFLLAEAGDYAKGLQR
jgi:hypothetical protein